MTQRTLLIGGTIVLTALLAVRQSIPSTTLMDPAIFTASLGSTTCDATTFGLARDLRVSGLPARIVLPTGGGSRWMTRSEQCRLALASSATNLAELWLQMAAPDVPLTLLDGPLDCGRLVAWPTPSDPQWRMFGCDHAYVVIAGDQVLTEYGRIVSEVRRIQGHATFSHDPSGWPRFGTEQIWHQATLSNFLGID